MPGTELEIGDFVLFGGPVIMSYGTVTKFSPTGDHVLIDPRDPYMSTAWTPKEAIREFWKEDEK